MKSSAVRGLLRLFGKLGTSGRRQLAITSYAVRTFFDAYLKGSGESRFNLASPAYLEIQVLE